VHGLCLQVRDCVRFGVQQAGNPLAVLFQTAAAIISLVIVWPFHGRGREPKLWEHLQRFVWTDDRIEEALEMRDEASHTFDMSTVRPACSFACLIKLCKTVVTVSTSSCLQCVLDVC
jgi:hypothetical protein